MGMFDNLRSFFQNLKNTPTMQENNTFKNDAFKKSTLITQIVNSVDKIKTINSFDRSIWNLANLSQYDLERKSLDELERLQATLSSRLSELTKQNQTPNSSREDLEDSKWTGYKPKSLTAHEFDRFQRDDR